MRAAQGHSRACSSLAFLQSDAGVSQKRGCQWGRRWDCIPLTCSLICSFYPSRPPQPGKETATTATDFTPHIWQPGRTPNAGYF